MVYVANRCSCPERIVLFSLGDLKIILFCGILLEGISLDRSDPCWDEIYCK